MHTYHSIFYQNIYKIQKINTNSYRNKHQPTKTSTTLWIWDKAETTTRLLRGMEGSLKTKITNRVDLHNTDLEDRIG